LDEHTTTAATTDVQQHVTEAGKSCIALGAGMMLVGILLSFIWAWLSFFSRSKSPRNGITGGSGQVGRAMFSRTIFCTANFIFTGSHLLSGTLYTLVSLSYVRVAMRKDVGRFESIN